MSITELHHVEENNRLALDRAMRSREIHRRARGRERLPLSGVVEAGRRLYEHCIAGRDADDEAIQAAVFERITPALLARGDRLGGGGAPLGDDNDRGEVMNAMWMARWYECGLPNVRIRNARAASFAATGIPREHIADLHAPWPAMVISLEGEPPLLTGPAPDGSHTMVFDQIEFLSTKWGWSMWCRARTRECFYRYNTLPTQWSTDAKDFVDDVEEEWQARLFQMANRILVGVFVSLSDRREREAARSRGRSKAHRRRTGVPLITDLVLGNAVRVDVRDAVTEYLAHGGTPPKVQSLVRGHWRWQAHGPKHSLRKWIHVEPFWRGPEESPVVIRPHVMR